MADTLHNGTTFASATTIPPEDVLPLSEIMLERGTTGLHRAGGYIREDILTELTGQRGMRVYREMRDNSAVIGACLFAVEMLIRKVEWRMKPADASPQAQEYADLIQGMLFDDLDMSWSMLLSEILSFLPFGFSLFELVYKMRQGNDPPPLAHNLPALRSKFVDGYVGLGKIAPRAQDTIFRWEFDATGMLRGAHQLDPWMGRQAYLPMDKCVLFRPTSWKGSPEGRSVLRTAYRSWYLAKHLENVESIAAEREGTGIPLIYVPPLWMSGGANAEDSAQLDMVKRIGRNVRQDEQACIVFPALFDEAGNRLLDFTLLSSPGTRALNINEMIQRHELRITQTVLMDMIYMGHEAVGSFALASSKTTLASMALGGYLMTIADVVNRDIIPRLMRYNGWPVLLQPTLVHGDVETVDLTELGQFIKDLTGARLDVTDLENHIRMLAGLPEREGLPPERQADLAPGRHEDLEAMSR